MKLQKRILRSIDQIKGFRLRSVLFASLLAVSLFVTSFGGLAVDRVVAEEESGDLSWTIYNVDSPSYFTNMTDRSMTFDTNGYPHVAYGGDHLYYAWFDGTQWNKLTVDNESQVGQYASIALDDSNNPRIAYYDAANHALKFAYRINNVWFRQTLDTATESAVVPENLELIPDPVNAQELFGRELGDDMRDVEVVTDGQPDAGKYTSIAIGTDNIVHISYYYYDGVFGNLKYATWNGVDWNFKLVDYNNTPSQEYDVGQWTSIATKSSNLPCISYMSEKYDDLKYACSDGTNWTITNVSEETGRKDNLEGVFTSLIFDSNSIPHISFLDFSIQGNYKLRHAYFKNSVWTSEFVDGGAGIGYDTSITRSGDDTLFISYYDAGNLRLKYAVKSPGGDWSKGAFDDGFNVGRYTSTDYDQNGRPGITFFSPDNGGYYYRYWNGSSWNAALIDESAKVGISTSLDISNGGFPHISYFNDVGDDLKYATSVGSLFYTRELVSSGNVGSYSSISLDGYSQPHVAYYDGSAQDAMFIQNSGGWQSPDTVDGFDDNNTGMYISMKVDNIGTNRMSYYDATAGDLRYAWGDGTNWDYTKLDTGGDVGQYTSIALDSNNRPFIAYYDVTNTALKFAYLSPTNVWIYETVDNNGDVGKYASLVLNFGQPQIAYYDETNGDLKFAYKSGGSWYFQVVDSVGDVGYDCSMATLPSDSNAHVSYYDKTNGALKYAVRIGGTWFTETVDDNGDVGQYTSIDLTPSGGVGISYFDSTKGDLKFAVTYTLPTLKTTFLPLLRTE